MEGEEEAKEAITLANLPKKGTPLASSPQKENSKGNELNSLELELKQYRASVEELQHKLLVIEQQNRAKGAMKDHELPCSLHREYVKKKSKSFSNITSTASASSLLYSVPNPPNIPQTIPKSSLSYITFIIFFVFCLLFVVGALVLGVGFDVARMFFLSSLSPLNSRSAVKGKQDLIGILKKPEAHTV
jgi:hypothetical protein